VSANSSRIAWFSSATAVRKAAAENAVPPSVTAAAWASTGVAPPSATLTATPPAASSAAAASPSATDSAATAGFSLFASLVTAAAGRASFFRYHQTSSVSSAARKTSLGSGPRSGTCGSWTSASNGGWRTVVLTRRRGSNSSAISQPSEKIVPGGGTAGFVVMPSITGNTGMTGMTGPSLPWLLSDTSTQISPTGLNGGRFRLNSQHRPRLRTPRRRTCTEQLPLYSLSEFFPIRRRITAWQRHRSGSFVSAQWPKTRDRGSFTSPAAPNAPRSRLSPETR
jgi:hypothetical protein